MGDIMAERQNSLIPNPGEQRELGGGKVKCILYDMNCQFKKCTNFRKKNSSGRINNRMYMQLFEATHHKMGGSGFDCQEGHWEV